jgi:glycosyltransferase involved in cell wall biosynthesis
MAKLDADTWIVIPAYNEEKYLEIVLKKVSKFTNNIVVIDDGSSDATLKIANRLSTYSLLHQINLGKGAALKTGCDFAFEELRAKNVIIMDADDQHDPIELPKFQAVLMKHQVILGVRNLQNMPKFRQLGNKWLTWLVGVVFGVQIPDILSGYKAFTKQAYHQIKWGSSGYGVELEIAISIAKQKLPFETINIKTIYHDYTRGMTLLDALSIIGHVISRKVGI